jgi:hypothetical protein
MPRGSFGRVLSERIATPRHLLSWLKQRSDRATTIADALIVAEVDWTTDFLRR